MLIDTHCHLNDEAFLADVDSVIAEALQNGVEKMIIPGANPMELERAIELSQKYEGVYFAIGVHPYDLHYGDIKDSLHYASHPKCVAIGECGLDYFRLPESGVEEYKAEQKQRFEEQIRIAIELDKPLILHVREASNDVYEILQKYPQARGVMHCYNADSILLKLSSRFYYGIGGVCTFKNARRLIEILPQIPLERILLETDAPYLTPTPFRGERNAPKYIPLIAQKITEILSLDPKDLEATTTQNARNLFAF